MTGEWKVELETKAALAQAKDELEQLRGLLAAMGANAARHAVIRHAEMLCVYIEADIEKCSQAPGSSGKPSEWEEGYLSALRYWHNEMRIALRQFKGETKAEGAH